MATGMSRTVSAEARAVGRIAGLSYRTGQAPAFMRVKFIALSLLKQPTILKQQKSRAAEVRFSDDRCNPAQRAGDS